MTITLAPLAEPNRQQIVELLREGPRSVSDIAETLRLSQPLVSKHLRVLRQSRWVRVQPQAQRRIYALEARRFRELAGWVDTFRRLWEGRLETLDAYLQQMKEGRRSPRSRSRRKSMR